MALPYSCWLDLAVMEKWTPERWNRRSQSVSGNVGYLTRLEGRVSRMTKGGNVIGRLEVFRL